MKAKKEDLKVWVPGEKCDEGLLVTDLMTGEEVLVQQGQRGKLTVPVKPGRFVQKDAVRAVLVQSSEKWAVVKLADGHKIGVRIVAGWQIGDGDGTPPDVEEPTEVQSTRRAPADSPAGSAA